MPFIQLTTEPQPRTGFIPLPEEPARPSRWSGALKTLEALGSVYPVAETAANFATQAVALPVAGLASLGTIAANAVGLTDTDPADVVNAVGGALTYQPHTALGQHLTGAAMYPLEKLHEGATAAGDATLSATGSPGAATAVHTAIEGILPMAIVPAVRGGRAALDRIVTKRDTGGFTPLDQPGDSLPAGPAAVNPGSQERGSQAIEGKASYAE
jgi:hypothetical protein